MELLLRVITGTPVWVWLLLAYLIWQGVQSLRPRSLPVWRYLIVPTLFIAFGIFRIEHGSKGDLSSFVLWGVAFITLAPISFSFGSQKIRVDRQSGYIHRQGSPLPLVRNLLVFGLQYLTAVLARLEPKYLPVLTLISYGLSGAIAGYFVGSMLSLLRNYWCEVYSQKKQ